MPMTDKKLVRLAQQVQAKKDAIKEAEAEMRTLQKQVCDEFERRGTKALEADGVRVTVVQKDTTRYSLELASEVLDARTLKRVTKTVLDPALITQQIAAGRVTPEQVAEFATTTPQTPYIAVSGS